MALANKLETIADAKSDAKEEVQENHQDIFTNNDNSSINSQEENDVPLLSLKKPEVEIKPLVMSQILKRTNPFLKTVSSPSSSRGEYYFFLNSKGLLKIFSYCILYCITTGLASLNTLSEKPEKPTSIKTLPVTSKPKSVPKKESFVNWHVKNKKNLQEEFPEMSAAELIRIGLRRYKEETAESNSDNASGSSESSKKRKLSNAENGDSNEVKRSISSKLSEFAYNK